MNYTIDLANAEEEFGYIKQLAIYQQLILQTYGKLLQPFIFAVSKQDPPDHMPISFRQQLLDHNLKEVGERVPSFNEVKTGQREPTRCELCDYCRRTKRVTQFVDADDLMDSI